MNNINIIFAKKKIRKILSILIIAVAIIVAAIIIVRDSQSIEWDNIRFNPLYVFLGYILASASLFISIPVWRSILKVYGVNSQWKEDILFYNLGLLGYVLPGGIWSIASRVSLYSMNNYRGTSVIVAGVLETLIIGIASVVVLIISALLGVGANLFKSPYLVFGLALLTIIILHPKVFSRISSIVLNKSIEPEPINYSPYDFKNLFFWIICEALVLILGSTGLFLLLISFINVEISAWVAVLNAWVAANAVSSLLFWLPGTPVLRDGAMAFALSATIALPSAIVFVVVQRIWSLFSLILNAFIVWLIFGRQYGIQFNFRPK